MLNVQENNKIKPILETFFSDYGYVIINKNDLITEDKLILCEGKNVKFNGKILVTLNKIRK